MPLRGVSIHGVARPRASGNAGPIQNDSLCSLLERIALSCQTPAGEELHHLRFGRCPAGRRPSARLPAAEQEEHHEHNAPTHGKPWEVEELPAYSDPDSHAHDERESDNRLLPRDVELVVAHGQIVPWVA